MLMQLPSRIITSIPVMTTIVIMSNWNTLSNKSKGNW